MDTKLNAWHCDDENCDSWAKANSILTQTWLTVTDHFNNQWHFCTPDCLMCWAAANSEPTEEILL